MTTCAVWTQPHRRYRWTGETSCSPRSATTSRRRCGRARPVMRWPCATCSEPEGLEPGHRRHHPRLDRDRHPAGRRRRRGRHRGVWCERRWRTRTCSHPLIQDSLRPRIAAPIRGCARSAGYTRVLRVALSRRCPRSGRRRCRAARPDGRRLSTTRVGRTGRASSRAASQRTSLGRA
jgi:hypothetical protein